MRLDCSIIPTNREYSDNRLAQRSGAHSFLETCGATVSEIVSACASLFVRVKRSWKEQTRSWREMLPNSFSVPISKRIRQTFGDKLPLLTSDTQERT